MMRIAATLLVLLVASCKQAGVESRLAGNETVKGTDFGFSLKRVSDKRMTMTITTPSGSPKALDGYSIDKAQTLFESFGTGTDSYVQAGQPAKVQLTVALQGSAGARQCGGRFAPNGFFVSSSTTSIPCDPVLVGGAEVPATTTATATSTSTATASATSTAKDDGKKKKDDGKKKKDDASDLEMLPED